MANRSITRFVAVLAVLPMLLAGQIVHSEEQAARPKSGAEIRRMVGQMVLVGFVGNKPEDQGFRTVLSQAAEGKISGVLYLSRNVRTLRAVKGLNQRLQSASRVPLLIAVDQEGGRIERLTRAVGFRESPSAASVAHSMKPGDARAEYGKMAAGLAECGFNLNLAPVVDLNTNPENPIIGRLGRSYSVDEGAVSTYARAFVHGHRAHGVLTSLKHFPGHGSSDADTHRGMVDVTDTWNEQELTPYRDLISSGDADLIMSAHVINRKIPGAENTPASLSPATLVGLLRKKLGFRGVVISDDLQMGAIIKTRSFEDTVTQAVMAGNDLLVFANDKNPDPLIPEKIADLLERETKSNPALLARIKESYGRIMRLKGGMGPAVTTPIEPN